MMGPFVEPDPGNASAAMIFSFFVAVTVTPWLMLNVAGRAPAATHADHAEGGKLGRIYAAVARPILASKARSWLFLAVVGALTLGSLSLFYTKHVTVKLLPFDNKSELSVMVDLPEGASVEATDAVAQDVARKVLALPEVRSVQVAAGTAAPFNFNGLVRHSYLRALPEQGDVAINLLPKDERDRPSHAIALDIRERIAALDVPPGTSLKVVEPPPGPPVMATLLARSTAPTPRPAVRWRRRSRTRSARCRSSSTWTIPTARPPAGCARRSRPTMSSSSRSRSATCSKPSRSSTAARPSAIHIVAAAGSRSRFGSSVPPGRGRSTSGS